MRSTFGRNFRHTLIFGLWSLGALYSQAFPVQTFAQRCLILEDPNNRVEEVTLQKFLIYGTSLGIYFVTTTQGKNYVIKVIYLKNFSPDNVDDFRGSQLIHQRLQGISPPPNVQFALPRYCQFIDEETIFSIDDELPLGKKGRLMLWMPKAPGKSIDSFRVENVEEHMESLARSVAQADTFLYQMNICLGHALNPHRIRFDIESGTLTIVNTAGVKSFNRDIPSCKYNTIGQSRLPSMFMAFPNLLNTSIEFYECPDLKQRVVQSVRNVIADRFDDYTITPDGRYLPLDQIIALIDQYKGMSLIPDRVGIPARLFFSPTLQRGEFASILLTNLPDKDKAALRAMHEQEIPKVDVQCGNTDPQICEAFQHYLSRIYGYQSNFQRVNYYRMFDDTDNRRYIPIHIKYNQITKSEVSFYYLFHPLASRQHKYTRGDWYAQKLVFK
ncbi:MAG: hypothetical protein LBD69_00075 [Puniceicoccales bacterium]|nr:hypothetical protein [Puniceicoccales bacterium]